MGRDTIEEQMLKCGEQKLKLEQDMTTGSMLSYIFIATTHDSNPVYMHNTSFIHLSFYMIFSHTVDCFISDTLVSGITSLSVSFLFYFPVSYSMFPLSTPPLMSSPPRSSSYTDQLSKSDIACLLTQSLKL